MNHGKNCTQDLASAAACAVEEWFDGESSYIGAYPLGIGGEGVVIAAERHRPDPRFGEPCASYVTIKLPTRLGAKAGQTPEVIIDHDGLRRLRAEHDRRRRLGDLPHLGQPPELRSFPAARLKRYLRSFDLRFDAVSSSDLPILITPLRFDRGGGGPVPIDLHHALPRTGCWCAREIANWRTVAVSLALGLSSMHAIGWAHGDMKPLNVVLYQSHGRWYDVNIIDFGMVEPDLSTPMVFRGHGTARYIRPERFGGRPAVLAALLPSTEDFYALGVLLLEVLLGEERRRSLIARCAPPEIADAAARAYAEGKAYATRIVEEAREEARAPGTPRERRQAFQLCLSFLLRLPQPGTKGVDIGRAFLAALDTSGTGSADPDDGGLLATQIRGLVQLGQTPGVSSSRARYVMADPLRLLEGVEREAISEWIDDGRLRTDPETIDDCVEWLRLGFGRFSERRIHALLEDRFEHAPSCLSRGDAYTLVRGLRLLVGALLRRESRFDEAKKILMRTEAYLAHTAGPGRAVLAWWVRHLGRRITEQQGDATAIPAVGDDLFPALPPPIDPEDERERRRAEAWSFSLHLDACLRRQLVDQLPPSSRMVEQREATESSHEAAYGALQMARAFILRATASRDPRVIAEEWNRVLPTLFLSAGWALVRNLHHEYAAVLLIMAKTLRDLFRGGVAPGPLSATPAASTARPGEANVDAAPAPAPAPETRAALVAMLKERGADIEECLVAAAECAIQAAEIYRQLDVADRADRAYLLAADCYRWCKAPEKRVHAIRLMNMAANNAALRNAPAASRQLPIDTWVERANVVYKGTAGGDPGGFLGRAFFNKYGVGMERILGGVLAVELLRPAAEGERKSPLAGAVLAALLQRGAAKLAMLESPSNLSLLDFGSGTGQDCLAAVRLGFREVTGVDAMEWCVRKASRALHDHVEIAPDRVKFLRADALSIDRKLADCSYDVALIHDTLTYSTCKSSVLESIKRALRPRGVILASQWTQRTNANLADFTELCDAAWLASLETQCGFADLLRTAGFAVEVELDMTHEMAAFFENRLAFARDLQRQEEHLDALAMERAVRTLEVLQRCAHPKRGFLGWSFVVARATS